MCMIFAQSHLSDVSSNARAPTTLDTSGRGNKSEGSEKLMKGCRSRGGRLPKSKILKTEGLLEIECKASLIIVPEGVEGPTQ